MSDDKPGVRIRKLTKSERREVEGWEQRHRADLSLRGYTTHTLVDRSGCFGIVLVEDPEQGRRGLLAPDGTVRWLDRATAFGALADANLNGVTVPDPRDRTA